MKSLRKTIRKVLQEKIERYPITVFPEINGWTAKKYADFYSIASGDKKIMGALSYNNITDKGELMYKPTLDGSYTRYSEKIPWDFSDVEQAVRYVYLQNVKSKIIDEIITNGEGDLENYFKKNPPALNNDYVDNYLDGKDFYISDKIPSRIPSPWSL
jgi:hypothetical protein